MNELEDFINDIKREYYRQYNLRFGLDTKFSISEYTSSDIEEIIVIILAQKKGDIEKVKSILYKAINWYINFHDNNTYPYGIQYLFSKTKDWWLLRTCIEASQKSNLKVADLMQGGLSKDEATRILRRGDTGKNGKQETILNSLEEAQILYNQVLKLFKKEDKKTRNEFRFLPTLDLLFKSEPPSLEYITSAIVQLHKIKEIMEAKHANI